MAIFLINYIKDSFTQHLVIQQIVYPSTQVKTRKQAPLKLGWDGIQPAWNIMHLFYMSIL